MPLYKYARASARTGLPAGSLSGVPFLLKDLGAQLMGTRTSGSSRLWEDFVADHDSTLVARYRSAGLNIFGDIVKLSRFGRDGFSPGPSGYHDKATRNGPRASCAQTSA